MNRLTNQQINEQISKEIANKFGWDGIAKPVIAPTVAEIVVRIVFIKAETVPACSLNSDKPREKAGGFVILIAKQRINIGAKLISFNPKV